MARVTIEDCMEVVGNRFALSVVAIKRARQIVMKKAEILELEKKLAETDPETANQTEVPAAEVVEKNMDKSSAVSDEEHKPILTALKEIADGKIGFTYRDSGKD